MAASKKGGCRCSARAGFVLCVIFGIMSLALGLLAWYGLPAIIRSKIASQEAVTDASATLFEPWATPSKANVPDFMQFYLFDVQNPDDVANNKAKPAVKERGPFLYYERKHKWNITWNDDRTELTYLDNTTYRLYEDECAANSSLYPVKLCTYPDSTVITTINFPMLGLVMQIEGLVGSSGVTRVIADEAINLIVNSFGEKKNEGLFVKRTVREIIFGYNDPIIKDLIDALISFLNNRLGQHIPIVPPQAPINANNSAGERENPSIVYTGKGNLRNLLAFRQWAGYDRVMDVWTGCNDDDVHGGLYRYQANMINGTEGLQFHPFLKRGEVLDVFTDSLFRSSRLLHTGDANHEGISCHRYTIAPEGLMNSTQFPPNCAFHNDFLSGTLNMSHITGAPIFASKPHFLDADPNFLENVTGIAPAIRAQHDTFLNLEPWTGSVMEAHQRLQINARAMPNSVIRELRNIRPGGFFLPIMWVDEKGWAPEDDVKALKQQLFLPIQVAHILQFGATALGAVLLLASIPFFVLWRRHRRVQLDEAMPLVATPAVRRRGPAYAAINTD
eukprot:m.487773 g.487773  ORF g.487773 m.487773 type:complete len:560 (+) comp25243_c0_seq1:101-1780(+)